MVVFATRQAAIRVAAARMIGDILRLRHSTRIGIWDRMDRATMADVINWTRAKVAEACQEEPPKPLTLVEPPPQPAPRPESGLPLFEMKPNASVRGGAAATYPARSVGQTPRQVVCPTCGGKGMGEDSSVTHQQDSCPTCDDTGYVSNAGGEARPARAGKDA
jgi:hypothetical protein